MTRLSFFDTGTDRFRIGDWHGDDRVAYMAPASDLMKPTTDGIRRCIEHLQTEGYRGAVTSALRSFEATPFLQLGFEERERLEVLRHDLRALPTAPRRGPRPRRARRSDHDEVLRIDAAAFDTFWQLDEAGLVEALDATPFVRFRVIGGTPPTGYMVCGRAARVGYLQRLAVHPDAGGHGHGLALVADALRWLKMRGANTALVNTQITNDSALKLYTRVGFEFDNERLAVLGRDW